MVNTVPRNLKEIHNYPAEGKVTNTERNHGLSGRFPDTVNVNIGPVLVRLKCNSYSQLQQTPCMTTRMQGILQWFFLVFT